MSRLRLLCIDVGSADHAVAVSAVSRAVAGVSGQDRLLCMGAAARLAGRMVREEREAREGRWLDDAANWLLAGPSTTEPPARPGSAALATQIVGIGRPGLDAGPLQVTERFVDLVGSLIVMVIGSAQQIDDIDNAHLWLVGSPHFAVDTSQGRSGGRAIVGVGEGLVSVVIDGHDATITPRSLAGVDGPPIVVTLGGANRVSVRGASP